MPVRDSLNAASNDHEKLDYESPTIECESLVLVTLGGTPDGADSGAPGTEGLPVGESVPNPDDEEASVWRGGYF